MVVRVVGGIVLGLIILGLGILLFSASRAPEGYENGEGFHVGVEPDADS